MKAKTYKLKLTTNPDGTNRLTRTNKGFNPFELIGILELTIRELRDQLKVVPKVDEVFRIVEGPDGKLIVLED